jgi:hypothetical protein
MHKRTRMRPFRSTCPAALLLCLFAAACSSSPSPGTVLSSQVFAMPPGATLTQACDDLCLGDAGLGCFECQAQTLSSGGPGLVCEKVECGQPPTGHE